VHVIRLNLLLAVENARRILKHVKRRYGLLAMQDLDPPRQFENVLTLLSMSSDVCPLSSFELFGR